MEDVVMDVPSGPVVDDISLLPSIKNRFDGPVPFGLINATELDWILGPRVLLGRGTYGEVFKYDNSPLGTVAVKFIKHNNDLRPDIVSEISLLRAINDINVVNIKELFITPECIGIVLPLATTTLDNVIQKRQIPAVPHIKPSFTLESEDVVDSIIYQVLRGIIATQDSNIFNGDYKPANMLVFNGLNNCVIVQIADFGLAQPDSCYGRLTKEYGFTRYYSPPEILLKEVLIRDVYPNIQELLNRRNTLDKYNKGLLDSFSASWSTFRNIPYGYTRASDAWAFGCTVAEILLYTPIFSGSSDYNTMKRIVELTGTSNPLNNNIPLQFVDLTTEMKKWYSLFLTYTGTVVLNHKKVEDFPLYRLLKDLRYKKYIPMLTKLLSFYPSDRSDLRTLLNDPVFSNISKKLSNCLYNQEPKIQRTRDIGSYCVKYLTRYQFGILSNVPIPIVRVRIHIMYYMEKVVQTFRIDERTKARAIWYMLAFGARDLTESQDNNDWVITQYEGFCLSAILLAARFEGKGDLNQLVEYSRGKYNSRFIFIGALKIFAASNFELLKSTSYDILYSLQPTDNNRFANTADILLDLSYFTTINSTYNPSVIADAMRKIASIIDNVPITLIEAETDINKCIISFIEQIDLCIEIGNLLNSSLADFDRGVDEDGSSVITTEVISKLPRVAQTINKKSRKSSNSRRRRT